MLDSVDTIDEAIQLAKDVHYIHSQAGFDIRNWASNSQAVINSLGGGESSTSKGLTPPLQSDTEKILGMWWCIKSDSFTYLLKYNKANEDILLGKRRPTKREVLRTLMSIFDPLGLLASFLVCCKILLQEIWRTKTEWDMKINDELYQKWLKWIQLLPQIENLRIPRCHSMSESSRFETVELHVFVDASVDAYAAVAYFRIKTEGKIECSLVGAKTKVAPQKMLSIPRLELQAALLGARLAASLCKAHSINIHRKRLWSDSKTVLCWLNSNQRKFRQFVAFRIGEILDLSDVTEWRWIPSKMNVADEATKWVKTPYFESNQRWFKGPSFLLDDEDSWPAGNVEVSEESEAESAELRGHYLHMNMSNACWIEVERFSKFLRLVRTVAYTLRFIHNLKAKMNKSKTRSGPITSAEFEQSESALYRLVQSQCFPSELNILHQNCLQSHRNTIQKSSAIYKHSPYLDEKGVIRIKGRIDATTFVGFETKRPIILPKNHYVTRLIIQHYHQKFHHHNNETVINELRQKYDIPCLRNQLKKLIRICQKCKNCKATPSPPEMAELPLARLSPFTRPFSFTGVDYFGPLFVKVGRHLEKRWGVIFTCLTVRSVHIEIAHSLTTDSCIMVLRNFSARRGSPKELYSDNGTNFKGAEAELRKELEKLDVDRLKDETFPGLFIKWHFNPPAAPHMGGSWERLIRSVKKSLKAIMPTRNPSDELLRAILMEVEMIINSRPLTYVPIETDTDEALTPNHFLIGNSNGQVPNGILYKKDINLRANWKISQQCAEQFWKRWVKEYLPDLTRRTKWYNKVEPVKEGDVVIIVDEQQNRNVWKKGIVIETKAGRSGQVRQATVQTATGILVRPATKLAILDIQSRE